MNKKVLLRERKRHTARRVVSTPSVVLPGYPPRGGVPEPGTPPGGYLTRPPPGVPEPGTPPGGGVPDPPPPGGYLTWVPPPGGYLSRVPPWGGTWPAPPPPGGVPDPPPRGGTWAGYPPGGGLGPGTPPAVASWHSGKCCKALWDMGTPPPLWTDRWMDGRTDACQNITFPRTPYAGGNEQVSRSWITRADAYYSRWPTKTILISL